MVNRRFATLFHVDPAEVIGKTDHDVFPAELADAFQANDRRVIEARGALEFEEVAPHEDGLHTYLSVKFPLFDDQRLLLVSRRLRQKLRRWRRKGQRRTRR